MRHWKGWIEMPEMKTWWIFGFQPWGIRPAWMKTADGVRYIPLFLGIWIRKG
jgi:hypothetical protein